MKPTPIAVNQIPSKQTTSQLLAEKMTCLLNNVRDRAYELFERRGRDDGYDLDDWLRAETELGALPTAQFEETETEMRIRIGRSELSVINSKCMRSRRRSRWKGLASKRTRPTIRRTGPSESSMGGTNYRWKSTRNQ